MEKFEFDRHINQELFYYILGSVYEELEFSFENDTFYMQEYNWEDEEGETPNFIHKPSGFKLWWYKYPMRATESNMQITYEQFRCILYDCKNSINKYGKHIIDKWWEKIEIN